MPYIPEDGYVYLPLSTTEDPTVEDHPVVELDVPVVRSPWFNPVNKEESVYFKSVVRIEDETDTAMERIHAFASIWKKLREERELGMEQAHGLMACGLIYQTEAIGGFNAWLSGSVRGSADEGEEKAEPNRD